MLEISQVGIKVDWKENSEKVTQKEGHVSKEEEAKTDNTYFEIVKKKKATVDWWLHKPCVCLSRRESASFAKI